METIDGHPVSEELIDAWVTEAENGYDVEALRRQGRKPRDKDAAKVFSIRLSASEIADLDKYAAANGWSGSQAIREALKNAI